MDVHCCNCGEPWDQYHLRHDLPPPEEHAAEGWKFGASRLVVLHCPCCPKDGSRLPDAEDRTEAVQTLAELLGDDDDLAAVLDDFGL